jgi:hypothetical protein
VHNSCLCSFLFPIYFLWCLMQGASWLFI